VFFVDDVISRVSLSLFGQGHWAVGANTESQFFD